MIYVSALITMLLAMVMLFVHVKRDNKSGTIAMLIVIGAMIAVLVGDSSL